MAPIVILAGGTFGGCTSSGAALPSGDVFAPLGEPLPTATAEEIERFERGREVMARRFDPEHGLGPEFSATFCGACHEKPSLGGDASRYRNTFVQDTARRAPVVQMQPQFRVGPDARSSDPEGASPVARAPLPLFGAGLLAEIPAEAILAHADPRDADGDGISGRVNFERGFVGRFGRKAQMATLEGFVRLALLDHLGITTDPHAAELDGTGPVGLATGDEDDVPDPEMPANDLADLIGFVRLLAAPLPSPSTDESERGRRLFRRVGCEGCHLPSLDGPRGPVPAFTDLLLHDMSDELRDGIEVGEATGTELRTAPLWGVAATAPYLHDGRADTLDDAIRWHGGEAAPVRDRYERLDEPDRAALLAFVESLGGAESRTDGLLQPHAPVPVEGEPGGPSAPLSPEERETFLAGRALFDRDFELGAGLGPVFNGDACRSCHFDPVLGGAGPAGVDVVRQGVSQADGSVLAPVGGTMASRHGVDGVRPRAAPDADVFERRQTPTVLGAGLIDAIPEAVILAGADPDDLDGDGIRGLAHVLPDGRVGRFGWKASVPSLEEFTRDALSNEVGLTVPAAAGRTFGHSSDDDGIADPEVSPDQITELTFFMRALAPPPRRSVDAGREARGEALFAEVGCARCHAPVLPDAQGRDVPLYSDLLLHDVAAPGEPGVPDGVADARQLRTPPLWGLSGSGPYMHDGRASTVEQAIAAHDGEARSARRAYEALDLEGRTDLLVFLDSL